MSLFIRISVGHSALDTIRVSRVSNTDENVLDPDTVSTYQVDRAWSGDLDPLATVTHRYGDGATELARLALNALAEEDT